VQLSLLLGSFKYNGPFHVLKGDVPLILGMEFLWKVTPNINWKHNLVTCIKDNKTYNLPTCNLGISDDNSFASLPTNDREDTPGTELSLHEVSVPVSEHVAL
jgi:hypothetical protein